jgi:ferritin
MIKKEMEEALNKQIVKEMFSSNLYLSMAAYFHTINLNGFANWMRLQAQEEMMHAHKFFDYLLDRGANVTLGQINAPKREWSSPLNAFEEALAHEISITESINDLADLSISLKDHATHNMLQWFIQEQVEEEATVNEICDRLKLAEGSPGGLFILDHEMKQRQNTPAQ